MFGLTLKSHVVVVFCFEIRFVNLICFHFELYLGQQARDALLLIMQLSNRNESIAKYIAENTKFLSGKSFFPRHFFVNILVFRFLATGLSALYSDLPTSF